MLEVSLLATIYTSSQRTEAGSGGISWAFPLVEGGETLPSSCSPLLATFDIASRGKGDRLRTSTFTLLRSVNHSRDLFCAGSLRAGGVERGEITIHVICWSTE